MEHFKILALILVGTLAFESIHAFPFDDEITSWDEFKKAFGKTYSSEAEEALRRANFETTLREIKELEAKHGIDLGVNGFSDLDAKEFGGLFGPLFEGNRSTVREPAFADSSERHPVNFDWRRKISLNSIEDQGSCGSCWAFATSTTVEAAYARQKNVQHLHLSRQELIDCTNAPFDHSYHSHGCINGSVQDSFKYYVKNGVFVSVLYPYKETTDPTCYAANVAKENPGAKKYFISSFGTLRFNDTDEAIMTALRKYGPGTVNINAYNNVFRHYRSGIIRNTLSHTTKLDHSVVLVGWGTEKVKGKKVNGKKVKGEKIDYWILRNQWGTQWGESGYVRVERHHNNLGINNFYNYPILK